MYTVEKHCIRRFIPGYAGNASKKSAPDLPVTVYPRLRGERRTGLEPFMWLDGLSPATRGTRPAVVQPGVLVRFIPGYAGNASDFNMASIDHPVYPRLRGERS
tara:strand:- start:3612 stop:3920 length:309 start_codon:yes stop_codon:yes gene_type:complete